MPRREEATGLVERGADEASMRDPGRGLVALGEREGRLVPLDSLLVRPRKVDSVRIVAAAPARRIVMGWDLYRSPPRSKCAL
jgi:hypothetical protein